MHIVFSATLLNKTEIECDCCGWKGKASDASHEYLLLTSATEIYCPQCEDYFGVVNEEE